ncbi:MAG: hypothetical protein WC516_09045 [Patescibacteria group bacterium]
MNYEIFVKSGIFEKANVDEVKDTTEENLIEENTKYRKDGSKIFCRWFPTNFLSKKWID